MVVHYSTSTFRAEGRRMFQQGTDLRGGTGRCGEDDRCFRAHFGYGPRVCARIWRRCKLGLVRGAKPQHVLWWLAFKKMYATEPVLSAMCGVTRKTWRKWAWKIGKKIASQYGTVVSVVWPSLLVIVAKLVGRCFFVP